MGPHGSLSGTGHVEPVRPRGQDQGGYRAEVPAAVIGNLNLVRALGLAGIRSAVVSVHGDDRTFYSRHCVRRVVVDNPVTAPELFVRGLERFGAECSNRPVLFYGDDHTLSVVSRYRERLQEYFRFRMPSASLVEALVDKVEFTRLAREKGLPIPETVLSEEVTDLRDVMRRVGLPCVLKPAVRRGWFRSDLVEELGGQPRKVLFVQDETELARYYPRMRAYDPSFLVQAAVCGGDDLIYSYHAYFDGNSQPLGEFVGRKVRTFPSGSGVSTYLRLVKDATVLGLGREIGRALGLTGVVKMDFKRDGRTGRTYLLEINPRYNLWNYLGAAAGVNLLDLAYQDCTGGVTRPGGDYRTDLFWLAFKEDVKAFLEARANGTLSPARWLASYATRKVYNVFAWHDPLPWVVSAAQYLAGRWRRLRRRRR